MPLSQDKSLLATVDETGRLLGVGRTTVYGLIRAGELEAVHIGKAVRIPVASIDAYVERLRGGDAA